MNKRRTTACWLKVSNWKEPKWKLFLILFKKEAGARYSRDCYSNNSLIFSPFHIQFTFLSYSIASSGVDFGQIYFHKLVLSYIWFLMTSSFASFCPSTFLDPQKIIIYSFIRHIYLMRFKWGCRNYHEMSISFIDS
jgi:hypothetical protein